MRPKIAPVVAVFSKEYNGGMRILFLCLSLALGPVCAKAAEKPNIIFIIADDLGWADVEFHGGPVPTPNLNKLLEEGVELTQHYVAPVCSPTRSAFMTGRYWSRFGVTTPTNELALPFDTVTTAKALNDAGYETCLTGKWHLGSKPEWGPNHFGFDHSYGSLAGGVAPYNHHYKKGPYTTTWHRNEELLTEEGHVTDLITAEAIQWIESRGDERPFFLYMPFTAVHLPIREPEEWTARVPAGIEGEVPRQYAACTMHLDDSVGQIVTAVEEAGKSGNTLIVFTSDNGGSTAENNDTKYPDDQCPNGALPGNNKPLRGKKGDIYEGGTRVPTIAKWPGKLKPGTKFEQPAHIIDWMPTFCALAGSDVDGATVKWDGTNLWPVLTGKEELPERPLYSAGPKFRALALRKGDWKLILTSNKKEGETDKTELFNLAVDPSESNDLAKQMPGKVDELVADLRSEAKADMDSVANGKK